MSEWISSREAAEILGVHKSLIPKMRRRGDLTPRPGGRRPPWSRDEVLELRDRRAQPRAPGEPVAKPPWTPQPPDVVHEWLTSDEAATVLGLTRSGVIERVRAGTLPSEKHDGRRWFRRDALRA